MRKDKTGIAVIVTMIVVGLIYLGIIGFVIWVILQLLEILREAIK